LLYRNALWAFLARCGRNTNAVFSDFADDGVQAKAVELDIEGIVAKRLDAPYSAGRQLAWLKIKNRKYSRQEALRFHCR
jgi:ATP-dependent DNA ligase